MKKRIPGVVLSALFAVLLISQPVSSGAEGGAVPTPAPGSLRVEASSLLYAGSALVEQRMKSVLFYLQVLAATEEVKSGRWEKMSGLFSLSSGSDLPMITWYVRPDGEYYTSEKGKVAANLRDRDYFPRLMAGETVLGPLVFSKPTGKRSAVIAVPVKVGEKITGGVGASIFLDGLSEVTASALKLPGKLVFFALAPDGTAVLGDASCAAFLGDTIRKEAKVATPLDEIMAKSSGEVIFDLKGDIKYMIFETSALTGWRFVLGTTIGNIYPPPGSRR